MVWDVAWGIVLGSFLLVFIWGGIALFFLAIRAILSSPSARGLVGAIIVIIVSSLALYIRNH